MREYELFFWHRFYLKEVSSENSHWDIYLKIDVCNMESTFKRTHGCYNHRLKLDTEYDIRAWNLITSLEASDITDLNNTNYVLQL